MQSRKFAQAIMAAFTLAACSAQTNQIGTGTPSVNTAQTALASGAPGLAENICTTLLETGQRGLDVRLCQGDAFTALGRNTEAEASFDAILVTNPGLPEAIVGIARIRLATDPAEAERLLLQVLARQPRNPVALNDLGIAQDLQGRHQEAQTAYSEAIGAAPDMRAPQVNLALSLATSRHAAEASRLLRPVAGRAIATSHRRR